MAHIYSTLSRVEDLLQKNEPLDALKLLEKSGQKHESHAAWWAKKAEIHRVLGQINQAIQSCRQALTLNPHQISALVDMGMFLNNSSHQELGLSLMERALTIDPSAPIPLIMSVAGRLHACDQGDRSESIARIEYFLKQDPALLYLFKAAYWVPFLGIGRGLEKCIWSAIRNKISSVERWEPPPPDLIDRNHDRIRVGYISPRFGNQSIGHVTKRLFESHNRDRFEVHVYDTRRGKDQSEYGRHIRQTCDRYVELKGVPPAQAHTILRENEVDILVDLNGYMGDTQIVETFALRPAPVQIYWLGHGNALGLPFYDYVIGDPTVFPQEEDAHYVEAICRLPDVFAPADPHEVSETTPTRAGCGLQEGGFIFCGFNMAQKIDPSILDAWTRILREVPDSQLWLSQSSIPLAKKNITAAVAKHGVDPERVVFAPYLADKRDHFARIKLADLFLDTFTVNAATTAIDALWAGVPVLTRPGDHYCARTAASLTKAVGLEEMICHDTDEYIRRAIKLANKPAKLAALRERLQHNISQTTLFDPRRFSATLEPAYISMWERAKSGQPPVSFDA